MKEKLSSKRKRSARPNRCVGGYQRGWPSAQGESREGLQTILVPGGGAKGLELPMVKMSLETRELKKVKMAEGFRSVTNISKKGLLCK